jgi:hypothetical protein
MRVLIFALTFLLSSCSIQLFAPQSTSTSSIPNFFVVGQENSNVSYQNKVAFGSTNQIIQAAGRYIIVDAQKNRILIYNQFPTSSIAEPDVVVGQPNKYSTVANYTGSISASGLNFPRGVASDGTNLIVADSGNNRVLIYNSMPTVDGASADVVIGQLTMTTNTANLGGRSSQSLNYPIDITVSSGKLFIAEYYNSRVLIYNTIPSTNHAAADVVVGQTNFTGLANVCSASGMSYFPTKVAVSGGALYVLDLIRVLKFNTIPNSNGASADLVIGEPNLTTCTQGSGASRLGSSYGLAVSGQAVRGQGEGVVGQRAGVGDHGPVEDGEERDLVGEERDEEHEADD